jgi:hypothetical protein
VGSSGQGSGGGDSGGDDIATVSAELERCGGKGQNVELWSEGRAEDCGGRMFWISSGFPTPIMRG